MQITETFTLHAPPDRVFAFLSDVPSVAACVPGVEGVARQDDGTYTAQLKVQLGPIRAAFAGEVALEEQPPDRLTAEASGRDRSSGSRAQVAFEATITEVDGGRHSEIATVADITIRGRLGQFGTGVIRATATEVIRDFVACADGRLAASDGDGVGGAAPGSAGGGEATSRASGGQLALLLRIVRNVLRGWWVAVRDRIRRWRS